MPEPTPRQIKHYGWHPQLPDIRDQPFMLARPIPLPPVVDLQSKCPPVYDQGNLGSCVGNGTAFCVEFTNMRDKDSFGTPSRLEIYYNARKIEGTVGQDAGANIRDAIKSLSKQGAAPESEWPYLPARFAEAPPTNVVKDALMHKVTSYSAVAQTRESLCQALATGTPVVFGISVYESFEGTEVARTGHVPMPAPNERMLGGHCIVAVGYDLSVKQVKCRNSWGSGWGLGGYFWIPLDYVLNPNLAMDFWVVRTTV